MTRPEERTPRLSAPASRSTTKKLTELETAAVAELRKQWIELFRNEPPQSFGPDLLRRSIAQRLQVKAHGGTSNDTQRVLDHLIKAAAKKPVGQIRVPRRIKPGSELVRMWKGKSHRIFIQKDGFTYDGKTYASLSVIAKVITGTKWNGPRFFGLRSKPQESIANAG